jgi:glycogen debranching enzyme
VTDPSPDPQALWDLGWNCLRALERPYGFAASDEQGLYPALFGRDSLWILLFLMETTRLHRSQRFAAWVRDAGRRVLTALADRQGSWLNDEVEEQPGKIPHEVRDRKVLPARLVAARMPFANGCSYAGFDQTFLYVTAQAVFLERYPEDPLTSELRSSAARAMEWIHSWADEDGDSLFEYRRRDSRNLLNQSWKDSFDSATHSGFDVPPHPLAWVELQGYAARALRDGGTLLGRGREPTASTARDGWPTALLGALEHRFWMPDQDTFAMALDGEKRQVRMVSSNPGHLLWAGLPAGALRDRMVARLFQPDLMTAYGLRTLSSASPFYAPQAYHRGAVWPFDNAVLAMGLHACGYGDRAQMVALAVGRALLRFGSPVESYAVLDANTVLHPAAAEPLLTFQRLASNQPAGQIVALNRCQGWSAAAAMYLAALLAMVDGIELHETVAV